MGHHLEPPPIKTHEINSIRIIFIEFHFSGASWDFVGAPGASWALLAPGPPWGSPVGLVGPVGDLLGFSDVGIPCICSVGTE